MNNVLMGRLLESETLRQQSANNSKQQFATSSDLNAELVSAIIGGAGRAQRHEHAGAQLARRASGFKDILQNHAALYERLRESSETSTR